MFIASNTGNIYLTVSDANIGETLFVSETSGLITGVQPAGSDLQKVRQVGFKISATEIKFFLYPVYIISLGMNGYGIATQVGGTSSSITDTYNYTLLRWTTTSGTRTFTVSTAGLFDIFLLGAGGAGGSGVSYGGEGGGGGGAGQLIIQTLYLGTGTYDVSVGAAQGSSPQAGAYTYGIASGINISPVSGILKYESLGGVSGGSSWAGGNQGYNAGGASYRGGYGGNPGKTSFGLYGTNSGGSNGSGLNGGGGGIGGNGGTRSSTTPTTQDGSGGGGIGLVSTFSGSSVTYGIGGAGGSNSGTNPTGPAANSGSGGAGGVGATDGQLGGSGLIMVRFRI
jgi:hypothetical protein